MKNPLINRIHIKEYLLYGFICAIAYSIFVWLFLRDNKYENFYLLYVGNVALMVIMGIYHFKLIDRQFEGKRSVAMMIAGSFVLLTGIVMSLVIIAALIVAYHPAVFSSAPADNLVQDAPVTVKVRQPVGLAFMIGMNSILVNLGAGSLISVLFAYAGKRNQVKDKPTPTHTRIHPVSKPSH